MSLPQIEIRLGQGAQVDDNVILGYLSSRPIERGPVSIGSDAVIRSGSVIYQSVTIGEKFQTADLDDRETERLILNSLKKITG